MTMTALLVALLSPQGNLTADTMQPGSLAGIGDRRAIAVISSQP